ncbi:hypothetical protein Syun_023992 [Stephania yunnanensis]|uniref:Uncharacterized protein n=1 Tax=Stephania yunnanensis TaxID=152371 RepID=A0AAP0FAV1_9MAGN
MISKDFEVLVFFFLQFHKPIEFLWPTGYYYVLVDETQLYITSVGSRDKLALSDAYI